MHLLLHFDLFICSTQLVVHFMPEFALICVEREREGANTAIIVVNCEL